MRPDLFPEAKKTRSKPRVMMHGDDFGYDGDITLAHMVCGKCGHIGGWLMFSNDTEARRGEPCPKCNTRTAIDAAMAAASGRQGD